MGDLRTVRWTGNGQDRVYVVQPDGIQVGWVDLVTGERHLVAPAMRREVDAALGAYAGVTADAASPAPADTGSDREPARSDPGSSGDAGDARDVPRRSRVGLWWRDGRH